MKKYFVCLTACLMVLSLSLTVQAQQVAYLSDSLSSDSIKTIKKFERQKERILLKNSHKRFGINFSSVYAFLDTEVSFDLPHRNLRSVLSLEQNLGLPANSYFLTGSFLYRITPRSGIYAQYYGINRAENIQTDRELIFRDDTIAWGTNLRVHFNTQVVSAGYLFSALRDPNAFLGFYFNVYLMKIQTGIKSDRGSLNSNVELFAPLPNVGILASFRLTDWLNLNGNVGFFSIQTSSFSGSLYDFNLSLMGKPARWLGINLSYQGFDVRVLFPSDNIDTTVDYNFRGPSLGLSFIF